jgi:hypothetical protein
MKTDFDYLFILKTNIRTAADRLSVKQAFDNHDQIQHWNVDHHDVDCVLRVTSPTLCYESIIRLINELGFEGAELE